MVLFLIRLCVEGYTILPSPSWVSYKPQAMALNKKIHWLQTSLASSWLPGPDDLHAFCKKNLTSRHLLILNYPSNSTGAIASASYLKQLGEVCRKHRVFVVSDEIYKDLCFAQNYTSISKFYPEGTIICDGISKWASAGGHRLGYAIFPKEQEEMKQKVRALASETYSCVANPIQRAAVSLFEKNIQIDDYLEVTNKILKTIASFTLQELQKLDVKVLPAFGGFYLFPSFENHRKLLAKRSIYDSRKLCENLLKESGVALLNGNCFGRKPGSLEARLSYVDFDGRMAMDHIESLSMNRREEWLRKYAPIIAEGLQALAKWLN